MHEMDRLEVEHSYWYDLVEMTPTVYSSSPASVLYYNLVVQLQLIEQIDI